VKLSCARCGTLLGTDPAMQGLCPACLLRLAITTVPVDPYRIVTALGEGTHGVTFLAQETSARGDHVALTVLHPRPDESSIVARFHQARAALSALRHPGISRILHMGRNEEGRVYLATEFVPGTPLASVVAEPLARDERVAIGRQLCDAFQAAHAVDVLHLALRLSKVRVTRSEGLRLAKVLDFGLAAVIDEAQGTVSDDVAALTTLLRSLHVEPRGAPRSLEEVRLSLG
jgi:serine/threonine-protein kinase